MDTAIETYVTERGVLAVHETPGALAAGSVSAHTGCARFQRTPRSLGERPADHPLWRFQSHRIGWSHDSHATAGSGVVELHRATADHALPRCSTLRLLGFSVERYKGYAELTRMELAPLTILVGSNNSGKTAVAQAIQLLAGGLTSPEKDNSEPLPLESGGIRHGTTFEDLLTGRSVHGSLRLSADLANDSGDLSLSVTVQNVVAPSRRSTRQIREWGLTRSNDRIVVTREGLEEHSPYLVSISGREAYSQPISWQGLIPRANG